MEKCSDNHGQPPGVHCTSEARVKDCVGAGGGGASERATALQEQKPGLRRRQGFNYTPSPYL